MNASSDPSGRIRVPGLHAGAGPSAGHDAGMTFRNISIIIDPSVAEAVRTVAINRPGVAFDEALA